MSPGMGPRGTGPNGAGPHGRWGDRITPGWSMMTPQERDAHRAQMRGSRSLEDCTRIADEHRALMQKRAQERGVAMPGPRGDACRGFRR